MTIPIPEYNPANDEEKPFMGMPSEPIDLGELKATLTAQQSADALYSPSAPDDVAVFTGKIDTYATGAQREQQEGRPRIELLSPEFIMRVGAIAEFGARKYAPRNWEKGIPLSRFLASAYRHILKLHMGKVDEDHAAMAGWNIMAFIHTKWLIDMGLLPTELDDMPKYEETNPEAFRKLVSTE